MTSAWQESIYLQREQLARILHDPLAQLASRCTAAWGDREGLDAVLLAGFGDIPHCTYLYVTTTDAIQISDNISAGGILARYYGRNRAQRPYMLESIPPWGFLLSDAYVSLDGRRPSLTALQLIHSDTETLGYLGADFDLRNLPVTSELYEEPLAWRQIKGDPVIRGMALQQERVESRMDLNMEQALSILEELLTERGVFQCQIHFSSSQATIWRVEDPFRYRIIDREALADPDICLLYPIQPYPAESVIPAPDIARIFDIMRALRLADPNLYLRASSINLFNGMVSLTFSCDGSHYMPYLEFLLKGTAFWFGRSP